jgi:alpha-galactosidase
MTRLQHRSPLALLCATAALILSGVFMSTAVEAQKFTELAQTPPMGWNTWNKFRCEINEQLIRASADAMVATGMQDAGYEYINIDDCWHGKRSLLGFIQADPVRFPSGIKALADYVHSKGLKLGIYSDAGHTTCAGYPGSYGFEKQDAAVYASWGIDHAKYDWSDTKGMNAKRAYTKMRDAIYRTGRPMVLSICEWGSNDPKSWAPAIGHAWRTTSDIYPCWNCYLGDPRTASLSVLQILDLQDGLRDVAGPGRWNDMDMLEVGNGLTDNQGRAHFTLWAIMNSPLITGNDLRQMSPATLATLTNREVIALNQDPLGIQAIRLMRDGDMEVYAKPLANNDWALVLLNRGRSDIQLDMKWGKIKLQDALSKRHLDLSKDTYHWRELWQKTTGTTNTELRITLPAEDVIAYRLSPTTP